LIWVRLAVGGLDDPVGAGGFRFLAATRQVDDVVGRRGFGAAFGSGRGTEGIAVASFMAVAAAEHLAQAQRQEYRDHGEENDVYELEPVAHVRTRSASVCPATSLPYRPAGRRSSRGNLVPFVT